MGGPDTGSNLQYDFAAGCKWKREVMGRAGKSAVGERGTAIDLLSMMVEKTYIVQFKPPETSTQLMVATVAEVADDYLWMFKDGELVGVFAMEVVESWSETEIP